MAHPLAKELQKLSESSKHAVADGNANELDSFREYLHIERDVEKELKDKIEICTQESNAQLLLVCGNVGDGKSHILSYLKKELKGKLDLFKIHNDATESFNPNETSNKTLNFVLNGFRDENIDDYNEKIILAINLGTLSNFLEENGNEYSKLKKYVANNKILDTDIIEANQKSNNSFFHHVNFTDYHMYSLTADGPKSKIITTLLERLVADTTKNLIYKAYKSVKKEDWITDCPIIYNYEFLMKIENREAIMNLIVQSIIKNKEIVSVRSLLNFFYDLIVPIGLKWDDINIYKNQINKSSEADFLSNLTPNYLFEHPELSKLFLGLEKLDPCKYRYQGLDASLIKLINAEKPSSVFNEFIGEMAINGLDEKIDIGTGKDQTKLKPKVLTKLFMRLNFFGNRKDIAHLSDPYFNEFISDLYFYNTYKMSKIKNIYNLIEEASRKWYGDPKKRGKVILNLGKNQSKYRVFKDYKVRPEPEKQNEKSDALLTKFVQHFSLHFQIENIEDPVKIDVDFGLYDILKKILKGYRPNKKDNNNHISFINFINKLINQNNNTAALEIDEVNIGKVVDFELIIDNFGEYKFRSI